MLEIYPHHDRNLLSPTVFSYARVWFNRFSGASPPPPPLSSFQAEAPRVPSPLVEQAAINKGSSWADWLRKLYAQIPKHPQVLSTGPDGLTPAVVDVSAVGAILLSDVPPSAVDCECAC